MKKFRKLLLVVLVLVSALSLVGCYKTGLTYKASGEYTYLTYSSSLGTNWNPHTWETNADSGILGYLSTPFVDISIKNSEEGTYQWVFEMATSIEDVTKDHQDDLLKYKVTLPEGVDADAVEEGYVFEFKLREGAKWQNGTPINADTYVESMKLLLDPKMHNYRANNYITGESAVAGGYDYYYSGASGIGDAYLAYNAISEAEGSKLTWRVDGNTSSFDEFLASYIETYVPGSFATVNDLVSSGFGGGDVNYDYIQSLNGKTYAEIQADAALKEKFDAIMAWWVEEDVDSEGLAFFEAEYKFPEYEFDIVGLYKVDDYTIRYVCQTAEDYYYFLTAMTDNWIVYKPLYEAKYNTSGELKTTTYNSSIDTTMSFGPYKIDSLQDQKQIVFVQNEEWYGYTKKDGKLYSETQFEVDGKKVQQYQTTRIVIDVMQDSAAKEAFLKGLLDDWAPASDELSAYSTSPQLYQVDETYTMRFFFNTDLEALQAMDAAGTNSNGVVLSNANFRKAFSLAIDRSEFVTATAGYKAAYSLINSLYFYNVYEDPSSIYRNTDQAMQAICDLYGVEYGTGKPYATLEAAYKSINGYNLTEAKALMKQACEELVEAGLYIEGQEISIKLAYKKGSMDSDDIRQVSLMEKYLNAAVAGSGFGAVKLEGIGNLENRYTAVPKGTYAIGYGAWGGAAFYPFTMFRVYMDPSYADLHEAACWDPATETLELTIPNSSEYGEYAGLTDSMTYQKWSNSMSGTGKYANAPFAVKLYILSRLEYTYLGFYYCIPLCTSTACSLLSYKMNYYTDSYSIMYGFGGIRLLSYNYDDAGWEQFVKKTKTLSYN